jgi:hypothetical protein
MLQSPLLPARQPHDKGKQTREYKSYALKKSSCFSSSLPHIVAARKFMGFFSRADPTPRISLASDHGQL